MSNQKGMAALLTVVIIGVATVIMSVSASLLSIGELDMGYTSSKAGEVFYLTDACMEETLRRIQLDSGYSANNNTLLMGAGSCIINIVAVGSNRVVTSEGVLGEYRQKIQVNLMILNKKITINNWQIVNN